MKLITTKEIRRMNYATEKTEKVLKRGTWIGCALCGSASFALVKCGVLSFAAIALLAPVVGAMAYGISTATYAPLYNHYYANYKPTKEDS